MLCDKPRRTTQAIHKERRKFISEGSSLQCLCRGSATWTAVECLNLRPNGIGSVQLIGKGNKTRRCPLWPATCNELLALIRNRSPDEPVFLNRLGQPISSHGVHWMVRQYIQVVAGSSPALATRPISPHTIRHTTATHLLRSGVAINTIRA